jgi:glycyl-tRNA synthetase alpha subunit
MSNYYLDSANVERIRQQFDLYDAEAKTLLEKGLAIPAYGHFLASLCSFHIGHVKPVP